jgi:segregation and condensation protein A
MQITNTYSIKVPVFEGPLDLLLHLIKENKIDIYDIPIALITNQYLEYLEIMKELNLEVASDFLVMAATLIYIKSRMLLPKDEPLLEEEQDDPRENLVQRLLEYQSIKEACSQLKEREEIWSNIFSRSPFQIDDSSFEVGLYLFDLNIFDLLSALKRVISKAPPESITISRETLTVKDRIAAIIELLYNRNVTRFEDLFEEDRTKIMIIITFLALLEILRLNLARVYQDQDFGTIWIVKRDGSEN